MLNGTFFMRSSFKKFMLILVFMVTSLLIGVAAYYFLYSHNYTILETRTFSCPGMEGFTFDYPVFEGWESITHVENQTEKDITVVPVEEYDTCKIKISRTGENYTRFVMQVTMGENLNLRTDKFLLGRNNNAIRYIPADKNNNSVYFLVGEIPGVLVELFDLSMKRNTRTPGFSRDIFWKTVTESFRMTSILMEVTKEGAQGTTAVLEISARGVSIKRSGEKEIQNLVEDINARQTLPLDGGNHSGRDRVYTTQEIARGRQNYPYAVRQYFEEHNYDVSIVAPDEPLGR